MSPFHKDFFCHILASTPKMWLLTENLKILIFFVFFFVCLLVSMFTSLSIFSSCRFYGQFILVLFSLFNLDPISSIYSGRTGTRFPLFDAGMV